MSLLRVENLGKSFGGNRAVDGIHFEVAAGELLALIGPNGAGKSTTFNMVNGQLRPDSGSVKLDGVDLGGLKPRQIWQMGVSRTFQIAETFASLTVVENCASAVWPDFLHAAIAVPELSPCARRATAARIVCAGESESDGYGGARQFKLAAESPAFGGAAGL